MTGKTGLRRLMRARLAVLPPEELRRASAALVRRVGDEETWRSAWTVALFASLKAEPAIGPLVEIAWRSGKRVLFPRVTGTTMELRAVTDWRELMPGAHGVLEPDPAQTPVVAPVEAAWIGIPGLAFDRTGLRLGRGAGFYDRFLTAVNPQAVKAGLFFSCQEEEQLPCDPWDIRLNLVVTEKESIGISA